MPPDDTLPPSDPDDTEPISRDRMRQLLAIPADVRRLAIPPPPPADWQGFASPELDE